MRFASFLRDKTAMLLVGWGVFAMAAYVLFLTLWSGEDWTTVVSYLPYDGSIVLATLALLSVARFYGAKSFEGRVWMFITAGLALWMVSELIWGIDVILWGMGGEGLPAILIDNADYPFLAGYIVMAIGFLYKAMYTKLGNDQGKNFIILTLVGAFVMISAFVVFIPALGSAVFTSQEKLFYISYVALDILLFGIGLAIALYWGSAVSRGWHVMAAGLLSMMVADVGFTALGLQGLYFDGSLIELAWVFAYLLIALAGQYQKKLHESFM